jgi:hypothetical protein
MSPMHNTLYRIVMKTMVHDSYNLLRGIDGYMKILSSKKM